jgi:hypothetical protein
MRRIATLFAAAQRVRRPVPPPVSGPPPSGPGSLSTSFTLTSPNTGTHPFAIGHAFREGEVPAGSGVAVTGATAQVTPNTYWPDGSLKHAIIAGTASLTANVAATIGLASGTASSGTALTTTDLKNTGIVAAIGCGSFGTASWAATDWDTPHYQHVSGHRMSSWLYRKPVVSDPHLVAWMEVRLYAGGAVEILPWIENAYLNVASPTTKASTTYTFTLGGTQRYSQTFVLSHHSRVPLVTGTGVFSYWLGTDPAVTPKHNIAYLTATKLVPNYGYTSPSTTKLNALNQSYTPNTLAGVSASMGAAGSSAALIPTSAALYLTSNGDPRGYRAALVFGLSGGSWPTHYRDNTTNQLLKFASYPNVSEQVGQGTPELPAPSGTTNGTPVITHQPSFGYLPYLISGWHWFWEESGFWETWNYLKHTPAQRSQGTGTGAKAIHDTRNGTNANRGAHWGLRTLAQTLSLCPTDHPIYSDLVSSWENNTAHYATTYTVLAQPWYSPQGVLGEYGADSAYGSPGGNTSWWGAGWMNMFGCQTWGFASDIGLPQSATSLANHLAVRDHTYKQVVGRAGDGLGGNYNWRRLAVFDFPLGSDGTGMPVETWYTSAQSYSNYIAGKGLASIPATAGLSLKMHASDGDVVPGSSTAQSYGPFALSALAYAVDHAAAGASEGWNRVSGASNYVSGFVELQDDPEHGITPRANTYLAGVVAGMSVGAWTQLTVSGLVSSMFVSGNGNNTLDYIDKGCYDPINRQARWIAHAHLGDQRYYQYDEATNAFSVLPDPSFDDGGSGQPSWIGHGYQHNAMDPATGDHYYARFNNTTIHRLTRATGVWTTLTRPAVGEITVGLEWLPEIGTEGGLIVHCGTSCQRWDKATNTWSTPANGTLTGQTYHTVAMRSAPNGVVVFGGGNAGSKMWKIGNSGAPVAIADCPIGVGINDSISTVCPTSGDVIVIGDLTARKFSVGAGTWSTLTIPAGPPFPADVNQGSHVVAIPMPTRGVIGFVFGNSSQFWLYRHA